jgi:isopenicillin N synthase-like dioxygenase
VAIDGDRRTPPIPRLDLGSPAAEGAAIGAALASFGALTLTGHDIDAACCGRAAAAAARAFALPREVKERYRGPRDGSQRGYLPLRTVLPGGGQTLDRKEAWHARPEGHSAANLFPKEVPELGPSLLELLGRLLPVATRVLASVGVFLGTPPGHFEDRVRGGDSLFRVNHYPDSTATGQRARFLAHRDFDLVTLLLGASAPGLEVQTRAGRWQPIAPDATDVVVTVGDILAIESAGAIASTPHRVVAPGASDGGRTSMVYFVSPRPEVTLANGLSAGEFVGARLREAGYA